MRLFYYFTFQPHIALYIDALESIAADLFHYLFILGSMLAFLGVWGHFFFGGNAHDWATVGRSFVSILRMVVYDYDLEAMELTSVAYADVLFITALWVVTNVMIWVLAGIVIDAIMRLREQRKNQPTLFDEAREWINWGVAGASSPGASMRWLTMTGGAMTVRAFGPSGDKADVVLPSYDVILTYLSEGGVLADVPYIAPEALAAALGVAIGPATVLVAEVLAASPAEIAAGWSPRVSPTVEAALSAVRTSRMLGAKEKSSLFHIISSATGTDGGTDEVVGAQSRLVASAPAMSPSEAALAGQIKELRESVDLLRATLRDRGAGSR